MHAQAYPASQPDAVDALRAATRAGIADSVQVACAECGWDADGTLAIIDEDYRQNGWPADGGFRLAVDDDAERDTHECGGCLGFLDFDLVVLRDRGGRCAQALADERSDDRAHRGRALDAALRRGDIVTAAHLLRAA